MEVHDALWLKIYELMTKTQKTVPEPQDGFLRVEEAALRLAFRHGLGGQ
jgi:hypothetical protein